MKVMAKKPGRDSGMVETELDLSYHLRFKVSRGEENFGTCHVFFLFFFVFFVFCLFCCLWFSLGGPPLFNLFTIFRLTLGSHCFKR